MTLVLILADDSLADQITAIGAIGAIGVSIITLLLTLSWGNFHKKLEIMMHFQEAYATLEKEKKEVKRVADADSWFQRYWHLQIREYEYWLQGYIRDEIYIYWMVCNKANFERPRGFEINDLYNPPHATPYTYAKGWETVKDGAVFENHPYFFKRFIERVLAHKEDDTFAQCILEAKADLFGWSVRLDRMTDKLIRGDPRKLFCLRQHR